ncbi:MAG: glycosyltransferase family 4 protein [Lachnospiraceae bacterium]|nr:glycosyltransferase family 4 protein [Lachnospiraceae bacterium]
MRILIAVHTYYPENDGVQAVTQYIAEGLAQKGHEVLVMTNSLEDYPEQETHNGVSIERICVHRNLFHKFVGEKNKYFARIKSYQPDVFVPVCTQSWPFDWIVNKLDKMKCKKVLYTHGYSEYELKYDFWGKIRRGQFGKAFNIILNKSYYSKVYRYIAKFDLVTYLHEKDKANLYAVNHGLTNGKMLGNAVEDRFFDGFSWGQKSSNKDGIIRFIYVAGYNEKKGQEMVLRAFYSADVENTELIFCGQTRNAYYEHLLEIKKTLEIEYGSKRISLLYEKTREEIFDLYRKSDVYVCGSQIEAFSISLCEAMASGLACISTDVGHASTVDGVIITNTEEEMAIAIANIAENKTERMEKAHLLKQYADTYCHRQRKVDWFEKELSELI